MSPPLQTRRYRALRLFVSFLWLRKGTYCLVLASFFVAGASIYAAPYLMGKLAAAAATKPLDADRLWNAAALFIGCNLLHWFIWHVGEYIFYRYIFRDLCQFESWLFRQVINRDYDYFANRFSGKVASAVGSLAREFREFAERIFYCYVQHMLFLPIVILTLLSVNRATACIFLISLVVMGYASTKTLPPFIRREGRTADALGDLSGYTFDALSNYVNIRAFKAEGYEEALIRSRAATYGVEAQGAFYARLRFWMALSAIVRVVVWPLATSLNVYFFAEGSIGIEEFSTFLATMLLFATSIWGTIFEFSDLTKRLGRIEELYQYLFDGATFDNPPSYEAGYSQSSTPRTFCRSLEVRHVDFAYPDAPTVAVLKDITIEIRAGEKIGIVGRSGSGKTTLIKLLLGYYPPTRGGLFLDGQPLQTGDLVNLLTYVPQDTTLFNRTLRDNIAYNVPLDRNNQEHLEDVARRSLAAEFIERLPHGFATVVGDRGVKLSAGQRQRIAIARALMRDKPIIILDEATSALDSESEHYIKEALENMWQGRTVIAIAHRLSTLQRMDRILVFSHGQVVESGSHHELLERGKVYRQLWERQVGSSSLFSGVGSCR